VSKLHDADYAGVLLASFDRADVVAMQFRQLGELLLRQPLRDPQITDSLAEEFSWIAFGHCFMIETMTTIGLHTISVIASLRLGDDFD
jgi:hypothetical protein